VAFTFYWDRATNNKVVFSGPSGWVYSKFHHELAAVRVFQRKGENWTYGFVFWRPSGQWKSVLAIRGLKKVKRDGRQLFNSEHEAKAFLETLAALHV
jgi:hypothetical protein